jgi:hypothetical protein
MLRKRPLRQTEIWFIRFKRTFYSLFDLHWKFIIGATFKGFEGFHHRRIYDKDSRAQVKEYNDFIYQQRSRLHF